MKQHKQEYREKFSVLKNVKAELSDAQMQIDVLKEKLISGFENWYLQEFDAPAGTGAGLYAAEFGGDQEAASSQDWLKGEASVGAEHDEEMQTFMRAKKKVEVLNRARKLDKMRR